MIMHGSDVDITNMSKVLHAVATLWQPHPASLIVLQTFSMGVDPSMRQ